MIEYDINPTIEKIQRKLKKDFSLKKMNAVLVGVAALAEIYYEWNQF